MPLSIVSVQAGYIPGFLHSSVYDVNPESKRYSSISSWRLTPYAVHSLILEVILLTVAAMKLECMYCT